MSRECYYKYGLGQEEIGNNLDRLSNEKISFIVKVKLRRVLSSCVQQNTTVSLTCDRHYSRVGMKRKPIIATLKLPKIQIPF